MYENDAEFVKTIKAATGRDHDTEWARQGQAWDAFVNEMWAKHRQTLAAPTDGWKQQHDDSYYRTALEKARSPAPRKWPCTRPGGRGHCRAQVRSGSQEPRPPKFTKSDLESDESHYLIPQSSLIVASVLNPCGQASLRVLAQYHRGASGLPGVMTRLPGICRWPLGSVSFTHFQA